MNLQLDRTHTLTELSRDELRHESERERELLRGEVHEINIHIHAQDAAKREAIARELPLAKGTNGQFIHSTYVGR